MQRLDRFDYSQQYLSHAYKELTIPANPDGSHKLEKNCLHIWPRNEFMLIALPNLDGSFTVTLFFPFEGPISFEHLNSPESITSFFKKYFADAMVHMPDLVADFNENPTSSMVMVKCFPWHYKENLCLLGDASHAIVPFYGQGMNAGFEDCRVFDEIFEEEKGNWPVIFERFSRERKPNSDAILELALRNYIEMRDKTADPVFILQKKIERHFSDKHPDKWIPLYSQVTFSHTPYSEALRNGERQDAIMRKVMNRPDIEAVWNSNEIEQSILAELSNP
jgi:kynurenine 3-monooxygenase